MPILLMPLNGACDASIWQNRRKLKVADKHKICILAYAVFFQICLAGILSFPLATRAETLIVNGPEITGPVMASHRTSSLPDENSSRYSVGDRLKITLFEQILSGSPN